jgi:site-specific DNA-methyltransferase (adenine-specific)
MFPAKLVHYFLQRFSKPNDLVVDPFGGRGTTALQSFVERRRCATNDLSPLAYVLSSAKCDPPTWESVNAAISDLETAYKMRSNSEIDVPDDIAMLFHPHTLSQLCFLRSFLLSEPMIGWSQERFMIAGCLVGILHGGSRNDGSSQFLSISMPNTFSMSPQYVRRYIAENALKAPRQNVFQRLREKLARLYLDDLEGVTGQSLQQDASTFLTSGGHFAGKADLVVTSPPYLQVVNYGQSNWIRLWLLGLDGLSRSAGDGRRALDARLDHGHRFDRYCEFMASVFKGVRSSLQVSGVAVFVIGDVATPGGKTIELAPAVWDAVGENSGLRLYETIVDEVQSQSKVSRIWGDTRGRATEVERVLVLVRDDAASVMDSRVDNWDEPYRDGGPDAAHALVSSR